MPDSQLIQLAAKSAISFAGTVLKLGAPSLQGLPSDERTASVRVDNVIHAPDAFLKLAGHEVVVQLDPGQPVLAAGAGAVLFTDTVAIGEKIVLREVGRLPVEEAQHEFAGRMAPGFSPHLDVRRKIEISRLRDRAADASAVVVATVKALVKAGPERFAEHDPDWWRATMAIQHVVKGKVRGASVEVLYANSLDVRWRDAPKPKAGETALWLLHATTGEQRALAPWVILKPEDRQAPEDRELIGREGGAR